MRVRYRKLSAEFDSQAYVAEVKGAYEQAGEDPHQHSPLPVRLLTDRPDAFDQAAAAAVAAVTAAVSTPEKVSATEREAELDEVRALLKEGKLTGQDLVNLGNGWQTIAECIPLMDDVPPPGLDLQKLALTALLLGALVFFVALLLIART